MDAADRWYENAIIYCLDVETFQDSNGDGIGDFKGLDSRLDYLSSLGVTCIWLLPFYPSPNRDNGYDVADYYGVDSRLGDLGDCAEFLHGAEQRGIRVIVDLVVNHTSDEHPWFQQARKDPNSRYRDYYVWSENKPKGADEGVVFPGVQESTWTFDKTAGAYYHHRFYKHQPDLNIGNPAVRAEMKQVMGFWLALGVSGFRVDAAPFLIELPPGARQEGTDPYSYLDDFHSFLTWRQHNAILLAEANVTHDKVLEYFGEGDRMQMIFNFFLNQHVFLALARGEAEPIVRALKKQPKIPATAQWANFLRNHDEIDLGRLTEKERQDCFAAFGPEPEMQLYERGVRRRLAPMLNGDRRRIELAFSLAFSLPGTPVLWYGDEIGMGDDLCLPERNSVRTPMQWSDEGNAGFSSAREHRLARPVVSDDRFGYKKVNVVAQHRDRDSLMNWMERLISLRKECPEFGWGGARAIDSGHPAVFAHCATWEGSSVLAVHNLGATACSVRIDMGELADGPLIDWFGNRDYGGARLGGRTIKLDAYGYRWFRSAGRSA
jgi:maltose alpha-D-glucosyltransferase / alpha-amylase